MSETEDPENPNREDLQEIRSRVAAASPDAKIQVRFSNADAMLAIAALMSAGFQNTIAIKMLADGRLAEAVTASGRAEQELSKILETLAAKLKEATIDG